MGMDVYGKNPTQNKEKKDFPTYYKYDAMEFSKKWKELDKDEKMKDKYFAELHEYEEANPGFYFRNNCWWWRPLWNYCYHIADDIISDEVFDDGHGNGGAGLDGEKAYMLGNRLLSHIAEGHTSQYMADYLQYQEDLPLEDCSTCNNNNRGNSKKKDCNMCEGTGQRKSWSCSYPFDVDNVKEFANFCIESGGFEIC